ncbi:hypothetical protein RZS08_26215, partial [Arthrospira platensis SPKY1]|nr:hypothetical protein [Arthrospira platensis SPKY1]
ENITIQSDLYSLGIVFYEMLTQKAPYQADNSLAVLFKHIHDPIPNLPKQYTNLQPLINKLLAKKISDRYQSTDEFINALEAVIDNKNRTIKPEISSRATSPKLTIGISTFGALLLLGGVIYTSQSIYITRNMETKELARFTEQHHTKFDPLLRPADQQTNLEPPDKANLPSVEIE